MDVKRSCKRRNPRENANIFSIVFWIWTFNFFKVNYGKILNPADLYRPLEKDQSNLLGDRLEILWRDEVKECRSRMKRPSLWKVLFRCFLKDFLKLGVLHIISKILRLSVPILLGQFLVYFKEGTTMLYETALLYGAAICLANWFYVSIKNHEFFEAFHIGAKTRTAICSVIYRKAMRLSTTALGGTASGKVVNLMANDIARFDMVVVFLHYMWTAVLVTIAIGYFLYIETGYTGFIGFAAILIIVPAQSYTGKLSGKLRAQSVIKTDERVQLMDEIISGVQVIKMYVWENTFCSLIAFIRRMELKMIRRKYWLHSIFMTCYLFTPRMGLYLTLITMMLLGKPLSASKVFVFFSYFAIFAEIVGATFVRGISEIAETLVAINRFQEFLIHDECDSKKFHQISLGDESTSNLCTQQGKMTNDSNEIKACVMNGKMENSKDREMEAQNNDNIALEIINLSASWNSEELSPDVILDNVNCTIERGSMNIIIGSIGSGKSSLILGILNEIPVTKGYIKKNGTISYASQESWIFSSTIRQNILFGQPYDARRYQDILNVCALIHDLQQFPDGDQTIVGERGSMLSGGQKARINMARAVYRNADIYIFDDPLSAVDTHVSNHLFKECFETYLSGKTRILATHQLQYLNAADRIHFMEDGKLMSYSSSDDFLRNHLTYSRLLMSESDGGELNSSSENQHDDRRAKTLRNTDKSKIDSNFDDQDVDVHQADLEETSGAIARTSVITQYFRTGGSWCFIVIVGLFCLLSQCTMTLNDMYFPRMVTYEEERFEEYRMSKLQNSTGTIVILDDFPIQPGFKYIYYYTAIVLLIFIIGITQSILFYTLCMNASQNLHDNAFASVIRAGMSFFDKNPSGRILNRFSKDLNAIDELLPRTLHDAELIILIALGGLVVVCIVNPIFIIPLSILTIGTGLLMKIYVTTARGIKRLEGILKSPVFTHLNMTLNGLITIRAYNAEDMLIQEFDTIQDSHSSAAYMFLVTTGAFGFFLDTFCCIFITIVTFTLLLVSGYSRAEVGLAITSIISMTPLIRWGMRQSAEVLNQMVSVERVLEYTLLEPEQQQQQQQQPRVKSTRSKSTCSLISAHLLDWPYAGHIELKDVYMRYEDDQAILKGLNCIIKPMEKVGIVGRSGAGKSSLISALFRLRNIDGIIEIDGLNISTLSLEHLRKHISIIPQNPVLFSGTLRKNLDPFNNCSDAALWNVLEQVELKNSVGGVSRNLDDPVHQGGSNFSTGQKQLICLARAILKNNKILVLDEATANVDTHTDELIQKTIRNKFAECTVLTVAHRLNTIMDSDRVMVLDGGRIVEFDHPSTLLQDEHGWFSSLVNETSTRR